MKGHPANMPRSHFGMPGSAPHLGSAPPTKEPFQPAKKVKSPYKKVVISVINKKKQ